MAKTAISPKREKSWSGKARRLLPGHNTRVFDPTIELRDPKFIQTAIIQGLALGDFEGVVAACRAHLRVLNRTRSAKTLHISRQSIHKLLRPNGTPSLKTFTAFMKFLQDSIPA